MKIEKDEWLTEILGCIVLKTSGPFEGKPREILKIMKEFAGKKPAFFYSKIPVHEITEVRALTRVGFFLVDTNIIYECEPKQSFSKSPSLIAVSEAQPSHESAVLDIAHSCFNYSRFHLDPQISASLANKVKRSWIKNYFLHKRGEKLFVATKEGVVVGFLASVVSGSQEQSFRIIDLIGVSKNNQNQGVATALVNHFINSSVGLYSKLRVGTQVANTPSIHLYENFGFWLKNSLYVLHAHMEDGKIIK